jgi:hypothetical protein
MVYPIFSAKKISICLGNMISQSPQALVLLLSSSDLVKVLAS